MKLYELFKDEKIKAFNVDLNMDICGISSDSRSIKKGEAFVAIEGSSRNGNDYVEEAFCKGASVIVSDNCIYTGKFPLIIVENARASLSKMWSNYYGNPTKSLKIVAITGTNGKTSSAYILYSILKAAGKRCGLISTVECLINDEKLETNGGAELSDVSASMTTPDPKTLYKLFYDMKMKDAEFVVMEASSHSLSQYRLSGADIYIGAFTNLSLDHLDYHKTMEEYFESKKTLFKICKYGIVNIDDKYGKIIKEQTPDLYTFGIVEKGDFSATNIDCSDTGCSFFAQLFNEKLEVKSRLIGEFVPYNIMTAISCARLLNISNQSILEGVFLCDRIKGRMERVNDNVIIDYAHTPEAIKKSISSVIKIFRNKKVTALFGCGGDRDKSKRAEMGRIASNYADKVILTSDNSRSEDKLSIIRDIVEGINTERPYFIIPERKQAIKFAIKTLKNDEILLLLGKGHEAYEIDQSGKHSFDERQVIKEALENV